MILAQPKEKRRSPPAHGHGLQMLTLYFIYPLTPYSVTDAGVILELGGGRWDVPFPLW